MEINQFIKEGRFRPDPTLVLMNGVLEVALGLLLVLGVYTRIAAAILGLHLLVIALTMGFTQTAVRDFGLAFATLAVALIGPDAWSLDQKLKKSVPKSVPEQSTE